MPHRTRTVVMRAALIILGTSLPWLAAAQTLAEPAARITDAAIHSDHASYTATQARIAALNASARQSVASYSLAKAQCWLDVSFHEYSRNDRSAFPQQALDESSRIVRYLEEGADPESAANPARQTPLVNGAARLRPDLWAEAALIKQQPGLGCAAQPLACAEVELVHAGNEQNQQQWRHAKPYVQLAEDGLAAASAAAASCAPPMNAAPLAAVVAPAPAPAPVPALALAAAVATPEPVRREMSVLFDFDRRDLAHTQAASRARLAQLTAEIASGALVPRYVTVTGHADVSNHTGKQSYNSRLARDRAEAVRSHLVQQGVAAERITVDAMGDEHPVASCESHRLRRADYQACLLPDRRVDVKLEAERR